MAKYNCSKCGRGIGGFFGEAAYRCKNGGCGRMFCRNCCKDAGLILTNLTCPRCGNEVKRV